ncbi:MAG: type IX secretion system membrane protein PorP/SprF [Bacteroidales bacterium]
MRRSLTLISLTFLLFCAAPLQAQQLPIFSQYVLNGFLINPAMAGHDGFTSFNTTARQQWLGFKEAPQTYSASWQTRLLKRSYRIVNNPIRQKNMVLPSTKGRVGIGAYVINDVNGNVARTGGAFNYAYHIFMQNTQLSFGLSAKLFQYRIYKESLTFDVDGDPVLSGNFNSVAYSPDFDFGVFVRGRDFFAGVSVSNLMEASILIGSNELPDYKTYRHYWVLAGYNLGLNSDYSLEPSVLLKTTENWNPQGDLSLKLLYNDQYWGGISYRTNNSLIALLGIRVESLYLGYSFDYSLAEISHFSYGSHEINLSVKIGSSARRYKWVNRY